MVNIIIRIIIEEQWLRGASVLERVGAVLGIVPPIFLEVTVEDDDHLDFSGLNVTKHGGVLLDGELGWTGPGRAGAYENA